MTDILIEGIMEMPKTCAWRERKGGCLHNCFLYCYCHAHSVYTYKENDERPSDCPLVALPEHGRLISDTDVKALLRSGLSLDSDFDMDYVCGLIDGLPTIVEANNGN